MKLLLKSLCIVVLILIFNTTSVYAKAKPNIILIMADDMGYGDAGFNGCKDIPTPALDSIASNGITFTTGYVTCPQCAPSRSAILTGRDQNTILCNNNMSLDVKGLTEGPTYASRMKEAGYKTGMVGKWHLGTQKENHPNERGFDSFFGFLGGSSYYYPPKGRNDIPNLLDNKKRINTSEYLTDQFGDRAVDFIDKNKSNPFFLYLSFNAPHTPMQAPKEVVEKFKHLESFHKERPTYAAMVSIMDKNIKKVLDTLKQNKLTENTLVIFLSDNGGPMTQNGSNNGKLRGVKGDLLEGGIRVPFVMQWPGTIESGKKVNTPISALDLLPTSLAMAGVKTKAEDKFDGANLLPALLGNEKFPDRTMKWYFPLRHHRTETWFYAVQENNWKLSYYSPDKRPAMRNFEEGLFNLNTDIGESKDLRKSQPEKYKKLKSIYNSWKSTLPKEFSNLTQAEMDDFLNRRRKHKKQK